MSKQKQDKQGGGWQFPRPLEIIKCKEGNKEYMKERPARKPYGRIVKVCEFSLEAVAEFGDDDARTVWRLAKRAAARLAGIVDKYGHCNRRENRSPLYGRDCLRQILKGAAGMSNKAELLKKIKALADRGVDGERESAQTLLARLMEQYGISETDLEEERRETAWFRYSQETERRLLNQIIYMVTGRSGFGCVGSYSGRKRKETGVNCTAAERLEIEANYKFFKVAMEAELEIFYTAFSSKNHLFPSEDKVKPKSIKDLTPEEREKVLKAGLMMEGMERHTLRKAIAAGETE